MFDPKSFLDLAENLRDPTKDNLFESKVRTSVGRSYYSVFLATRNKIEKITGKDLEKKKNPHEIIITRLKGSSNTQLAEFGTDLDSLRTYRRSADYVTKINLQQSAAENAFKLARELFGNLKNLPQNILQSEFKNI
jgi:uncharacterized protein (UPF0332 family)